MRSPVLHMFAAGWLLCSCGPSATEGGFESANPAARMYAIAQAARQGDRAAIGDLIEQLDADDPAVRYMAITTLKRLTGQTYGYRHYDSLLERREAIARWVAAYESGAIEPMNSGSTTAPASDAPAVPHGPANART